MISVRLHNSWLMQKRLVLKSKPLRILLPEVVAVVGSFTKSHIWKTLLIAFGSILTGRKHNVNVNIT